VVFGAGLLSKWRGLFWGMVAGEWSIVNSEWSIVNYTWVSYSSVSCGNVCRRHYSIGITKEFYLVGTRTFARAGVRRYQGGSGVG